MTDRVNASRAPEPAPTPEPPDIKHCWVSDRHGRLPALLLGWEQHDGEWRGRVVRAVPDGEGWVLVEEWLPAVFLEKG